MNDSDEPVIIASPRKPRLTAKIWFTRDVAEYIGVQPATVSTYHARSQMPTKDAKRGNREGWKPATIIAWHASRRSPGQGGHKPGQGFGKPKR